LAGGSAIAITSSVIIGSSLEDAGYGILAFIGLGIYAIPAGALLGMAVSANRIRIPLKRSYENFTYERSWLERYSYINESSGAGPKDPRGFLSFSYGASFPLGKLAGEHIIDETRYNLKTGVGGSLKAGYRFTQHLGIFVSNFDTEHILQSHLSGINWSLGGIGGGPLFSFPAGNYSTFDLMPGIGYSETYYNTEADGEVISDGKALILNAAFRYRFSRRWAIVTEAMYLYSDSKFGTEKINCQAIALDLGIAYLFKLK
jgi:hypothetical protein